MSFSTNPKKLILDLFNSRKAIFAFNIFDIDSTLGVLDASKELNTSIIIQTSEKLVNFYGAETLFNIISLPINNHPNDIILHLDHCLDFDVIKDCLVHGWNSVMFDGSCYDIEKNILLSKKCVEMAHKYNAIAECEIGQIGGEEDDIISEKSNKVPLREVENFLKNVNCDLLAIGIGNKHGYYKNANVYLDLSYLKHAKKIKKQPLVLHGGTGIPFSLINKTIKLGVVKVNISTELKQTFDKSCLNYSKQDGLSYYDFKIEIRKKINEIAKQYINIVKR